MIRRWVLLALIVGALVRLPGAFWGFNWPGPARFVGHHPDEWSHLVNAEVVMNPTLPPRYVHPYPKALGAIVGAPMLAASIARGHYGATRPASEWTMLAGRLVSIAFGLGSILLVYLIGRDVLGDARVGAAASWLLALGGMHVTQSHFFVADVPVTTWLLLCCWALWRDFTQPEGGSHEWLRWGAFFCGAAFAMKLFFFAFPALAVVTCLRAPFVKRFVHVVVFTIAGVWVSTIGFDNLTSLAAVLAGGTNDPYVFDRQRAVLLYAVQLPGIFSFPLLLLGMAGTVQLMLHALPQLMRKDVWVRLLLFGSPPAMILVLILVKLDHFPRHWVPLIPWAALAGGWAVVRLVERLRDRPAVARITLATIGVWMLLLVVDSERGFLLEPRNDAMRWVQANVAEGSTMYWSRHSAPAGYELLRWPDKGDPDILVIEMYDANNFLSGIGWRDSYPTDPTTVFDVESPERLAAFQSLFKGTSNYREVARFSEGYVMPEHLLSMRLLGDRARSYLTEVVIFRRSDGAPGPAGD